MQSKQEQNTSVTLISHSVIHFDSKIKMENCAPIRKRDVRIMAYTPEVSRVCNAIHDNL